MKCYIKDYPRPQLVRKDWKNLNGEVEILVWGRGAAAGPGDHSTVYL